MIENWETAFAHVLQSEGGYVNDPADPGGETNFGVTKAAWAAYIGREVEAGEMRALTVEDVKPFYKSRYWDANQCDSLPAGVDYAVFDFGVNAGIKRSAKFLQQAVGVGADGSIGQGTLDAVAQASPVSVIEAFSKVKDSFYRELVVKNPTEQKFLHGWLNRIEQVEKTATQMA
jgi:lysozyme family protein